MTSFVRRIHSLQRSPDNPLILAYGSWANVAGRPGAACNRGHPPCIGKGLRATLAKSFLVVCTPESHTSKTCSFCLSECGPCAEVDEAHRERMVAEANGDVEKIRRAQRFSVRGVRRCCNNDCAAYLNRDYNAAINIQRRCKSSLTGSSEAIETDTVDARLDRLCFEIQHST